MTVCTMHLVDPRRPGYLCCVHVLNAHAPIAHFLEAYAASLGEVLCEPCVQHGPAATELRVICPSCLDSLIASAVQRE